MISIIVWINILIQTSVNMESWKSFGKPTETNVEF